MRYSELATQHFFAPCNSGEFADAYLVRTAIQGSRESGAIVQFQVLLDVDTEIIQATKFKAYGCVATIASCSWLTEYAKGRSITMLRELDAHRVMQVLEFPLVKRHRVILVVETFKKTLGAVDHSTISDLSP